MARQVRMIGLGLALCGLLAAAPATSAAPAPTPSPAGGMFSIGDASTAAGQTVLFWGAQWARDNTLSGGAPDAFKGFADVVHPTSAGSCTGTFVARPGDSAAPPAQVSGDITVLVVTGVTQSGNTISGTYSDMVTVEVEPGYGPNPGHPGIGTVIGPACAGGSGGGGGDGGCGVGGGQPTCALANEQVRRRLQGKPGSGPGLDHRLNSAKVEPVQSHHL